MTNGSTRANGEQQLRLGHGVAGGDASKGNRCHLTPKHLLPSTCHSLDLTSPLNGLKQESHYVLRSRPKDVSRAKGFLTATSCNVFRQASLNGPLSEHPAHACPLA